MLKLLEVFSEFEGEVWCVSWHLKGAYLAACSQKSIILFNLCKNDGSKINELNSAEDNNEELKLKLVKCWESRDAHKKTVRSVSWSLCGRYLGAASFDSTVSIWELRKNGQLELLVNVEGHESEVKSVSWSPSGEYFATCGRDKQVIIWSINTEDEAEVECESILVEHSGDVKKVVWHPSEDILASVGYDNKINLFKNSPADPDWSVFSSATHHTSTVWSLDFNSTGTQFITCSADSSLILYNDSSDSSLPHKAIKLEPEHEREILDVSWNKSNNLIATGCGDNFIRVIQESDGEFSVADIKEHGGEVNSVEWNPVFPHILATGGEDGSIKIWHWFTGS